MVEKKEPVGKTVSKASVAYRNAEKVLRETYTEEFNRILDEEYVKLGAVSPRKRKEERDKAALLRKEVRDGERKRKAMDKVLKAQEALAAARKAAGLDEPEEAQTTIDGGEVPYSKVVEGGLAVFKEPAEVPEVQPA